MSVQKDISRVRKVASYFSSSCFGISSICRRRRPSFFSTTNTTSVFYIIFLILQLVGDAIDEFFGRRTGRTG